MLIPALNPLTGHIVLKCEPEPALSIHLNGASNQCQWRYSAPSITVLLHRCLDSKRRKMLAQTHNGNTYLGCEHRFWSKIARCLCRKSNRGPASRGSSSAARQPLRGLYVPEPFGILRRAKSRNEGGLPEREADLSSLSAPTQETGMLGVRTTHASLQFIILWGGDQLPKRQLNIARDLDIKPHRDCCVKKRYHLALNLIMLWERERASEREREIAGVIRTSLRGE